MKRYRVNNKRGSPDIVQAEAFETKGVWLTFYNYNGTTVAIYSAYNIRSVDVLDVDNDDEGVENG